MIATKIRYIAAVLSLTTLASLQPAAQQRIFMNRPDGPEYKMVFRMAQNAFEAGDYGNAVSYAEQAKEQRKKQTVWERYSLEQVQRISAVRRAGDYFDDVLPVLLDYKEMTAYNIIHSYVDDYGPDFFGNTVSGLKQFLATGDAYPEADYLIGKVYRLEGETDLSAKYLGAAYASIANLDVPAVKYDILYDLADLAMDQANDQDFEKYLLLILKDDQLYTDPGFMNSLIRIIEADSAEAVAKFFLLYRSETDISVRALEQLTTYYNRTGESEKALRAAALGCITSLSRIQKAVQSRMSGYTYTDIAALLDCAGLYEDIVDWGNRNNIWELFYAFAETCATCGHETFSRTLLTILGEHEPEPYWRAIAQNARALSN